LFIDDLLHITRSYRLSSNGIFLLENSHDLFMWIGRAVNPAILNTLFGLNTLEGADMQTLRIIPENSDFSTRVDAVISALRSDRARYGRLLFATCPCAL
jgi:protein transport protein SEC24